MGHPTPERQVRTRLFRGLLTVAASSLALVGLAVGPADANADGTGLVISEVYGGGGNVGAAYNADFVELFNPTDAPISLTGLSVHFRSATGSFSAPPFALTGSLPAQHHYLVRMSGIRSNGVALPTPDAVASPKISMASRGGQVFLLKGSVPVGSSGNMVGNPKVVDMVGLGGGSKSFETAPGPGTSVTLSANRHLDGDDTDDNSEDFALAGPSPTAMEAADTLSVSAALSPGTVPVRSGTITVDVALLATGPDPGADIEIWAAGRLEATVTPDPDGTASATLGPFPRPGKVTVKARYVGDLTYPETDSAAVPLTVAKALPALTVAASPSVIHAKTTRPTVSLRLEAAGFTVKGKVRVRAAGQTWTRVLTGGRAQVRLPSYASVGSKPVTVVFLGSGLATRVSTTVLLSVVP